MKGRLSKTSQGEASRGGSEGLGDADLKNKYFLDIAKCKADLAKRGYYLIDRELEESAEDRPAEEIKH